MNFTATLNCSTQRTTIVMQTRELIMKYTVTLTGPHWSPITHAEIKRCISKLKNGKSPGSDIINEYMKCRHDLLCPLYVELFS